MQHCMKCGSERACVPCGILMDVAFEGANGDADQVQAFQSVLERLGLPAMEERSIVDFVNSVRVAYNSLQVN